MCLFVRPLKKQLAAPGSCERESLRHKKEAKAECRSFIIINIFSMSMIKKFI